MTHLNLGQVSPTLLPCSHRPSHQRCLFTTFPSIISSRITRTEPDAIDPDDTVELLKLAAVELHGPRCALSWVAAAVDLDHSAHLG